MEESVLAAEYESIQHFISDSLWKHQPVLDQIVQDANCIIGNQTDTYLLIDESAFSKKGKNSDGVARQLNGRLDKVDKCQVAVFAAPGCQDKVTLTDARLYLPKEWTDDKDRCLQAGVSEKHLEFKTKVYLALEMVERVQHNQLTYNWIGADALYGKDFTFRQKLSEMGDT